jgi:hypothetical protein
MIMPYFKVDPAITILQGVLLCSIQYKITATPVPKR